MAPEDGFGDEDKDRPKQAGISRDQIDWADKERRDLALVKACEISGQEDDDFAVIARAQRFLAFLRGDDR